MGAKDMPENMKSRIAQTFLSMAEEKPIDKITVTDLVERCGISRQTFYYHFKDLVDVLEWVMGQAVERTLERSLKAGSARQALELFIAMTVEKRSWIQHLLHSQHREQIERVIVEGFQTYLREMLRFREPQLSVSQADLEVALAFCSCGMAAILVFKGMLAETGAVHALADALQQLPLPSFLVFALIFLLGSIVAGSQTMIVVCMPIVYAVTGEHGAAMLVMLMAMCHAGNQLSPTHVCLSVVSEYYGISLGDLIKKAVPVNLIYCAVAVAYYVVWSQLAAFLF